MATAMTATAGEHYVAYRLSALGLLAALTRGGSPAVDILVASPSGRDTFSLQVKTSNWARRSYKRRPDRNHWEWFVGSHASELRGENIYYAFVDLKGGGAAVPDVYVIPSMVVSDAFAGTNHKANVFWLMDGNREKYLEAWPPVVQQLQSSQTATSVEAQKEAVDLDEPAESPLVAELTAAKE